ncbi:MAG TPA: DcaP family trimeric outer membrane transporter [Candidatus Polarisedimenticolaceae bacterium]|nr:DcaP family trimeric outer membrane transporter [Candidatus Polarisedimenticolaceae bacterium]
MGVFRHLGPILSFTTLSIGATLLGTGPSRAAAASAPGRSHKDHASQPAHQQKPADESDKGLFPDALQIPGTEIFVKFGGYAKVDFIQDLDPIGNESQFKTDTIPVDGTPEADQDGKTTIQARETRFNVDFRTERQGTKLRAFFEGDFYGDGDSFRMRHAYGEAGRLLGGQTWTTFMDISVRPLTIDYEGPDGELFVRQAMIRYTQPLSARWTWAIAVEDPSPQFVVPGTLAGSPRSEVPDVPTYFRYAAERGHVQLAAIARQIRFDGTQGSPDLDEIGWGVSGTFRFKVYEKDELMGQLAHGEGIGRYVESMIGQNVDALITPANELRTIPLTATVIGYIHHWSDALRSGISYAIADLDDDPLLPTTTIARTEDLRLNLIHSPIPLLDYGVEVLHGRRENQDDASGDAWRVQFAMTVHFN